MTRYRLHLTGGHTRVLKAKTPTQAKHKYYGSNDHLNTEYSVLRIEKFRKK